MDLTHQRKLKERGIKIAYAQIEEEGFITYYQGQPVMMLQEGLPEIRENEVVAHELGHYDHDNDAVVYGNYKDSDRARTVMEGQANDAMLKQTLSEYLNYNDLTPKEINPVQFLQSYGLSMGLEDNVNGLLRM
ncbi:ImmA/IrrE family metallo-endopeptidase [Limosilactobacillus ingluviei]|uniref:ImmA/IrrE family metallo-endopeptidase n=1 Tax=Limosilactobacillus ingluviei TaxID=148604 RepID=UPI0024B9AE71|nr:ImmA/IrrE family metallo-endopeptidase [Limosilactobacillus ingluviei]